METYTVPWNDLPGGEIMEEEDIKGFQEKGVCEDENLFQVMDFTNLAIAIDIPECWGVNGMDSVGFNYSQRLSCVHGYDLLIISFEKPLCQGKMWSFEPLNIGLDACRGNFELETNLTDYRQWYMELFSYRFLCEPSSYFTDRLVEFGNYSLTHGCGGTEYGKGYHRMDKCIWNTYTNFTDFSFYYKMYKQVNDDGETTAMVTSHWKDSHCIGAASKTQVHGTSSCYDPETDDEDRRRRSSSSSFEALDLSSVMSSRRQFLDNANTAIKGKITEQLKSMLLKRTRSLDPSNPFRKAGKTWRVTAYVLWGTVSILVAGACVYWLCCCTFCMIPCSIVWKIVLNGKELHWTTFI